MSWFNESFNNIKGQITNLANNVLAEEGSTDLEEKDVTIERLTNYCTAQQHEIERLQQLTKHLNLNDESFSTTANNDAVVNNQSTDSSWNWEPQNSAIDNANNSFGNNSSIVQNLKKQISELENDKKELTANLELLDNDFQQNIEKIAKLKDDLQKDYNELEDKFTQLQEQHETVLRNNDKQQKDCLKCEELLKQIKLLENQKIGSDNNDLKEKQKLIEGENKILVAELKKNSKTIAEYQEKIALDAENAKKLAIILEGYEEQVSDLKTQLELAKQQQQQLSDVDVGGKIVELETELKKMRENKQHTHEKYINILTENIKKYADCDKPSNFRPSTEPDPQLCEFNNQVESILNLLSDLKNKNQRLENDLFNVQQEKTNLLQEKNHEIEKLLENSEILSQEVITKSQTIQDYEKECGELIKNNDMLISELAEYKNNSGLQTICESNEDNLLLLETQLDNANKRIEELENSIAKYENNDAILEKFEEDEVEELRVENDKLKKIIEKLEHEHKSTQEEREKVLVAFEKVKNELENTEYQYSEINVIMETLKEEIEVQRKKVEELVKQNIALEKTNGELERNGEDLRGEVNLYREKLMLEDDNSKQLANQNRQLIEKMQNAKMCETSLKLQYDTINKELSSMNDAKKALEISLQNTLATLNQCEERNVALQQDNDELQRKLETNELKLIELERKASDKKEFVDVNLEKNNEQLSIDLENAKETILALENEKKATSLTSQHLKDELKKTNEELNRVKVEYEEKLATFNEDLENMKKNHSIAIDNLKLELASVYKERDNLINQLSLNQSSDINIEHLQNKIDELSSSLAENKKLIDSLQLQLMEVSAERDNLKQLQLNGDSQENVAILQKQIEELILAKTELTNAVLTKHQESVTYHNEIQRLTQLINMELEKNHNLQMQYQSVCEKCEMQKQELNNLTKQHQQLLKQHEQLSENMLNEQNKIQQLLSEKLSTSASTPTEKEQSLAKKLERLQTHLMEVEDHYTTELLRAEEINKELQAKVNEIEEREKNSSTMYTSVSIRANQHVETLQHQLQLITNQRDDLRKKISDAEDYANKQAAALANLQFVLEQFQKDKDSDVLKETERIRRQIGMEKQVQDELKKEVLNLQMQLEESKQGLQAASRLSDQLEQSKHFVSTLKAEVAQLKEKLEKSEEKLKNAASLTDGKVDKSLIKNLIIGFVTTNNNLNKDQMQILKIIATVLDFNQQDHDKVNLNKIPQQGWLGSILSPQTTQGMSQESISQAFVKFLEAESKPRQVPSLLNQEDNATMSKSRKTSTSSMTRQSPGLLAEVVLPTFADFAQNRNSSSILKDVLKDNS